jgi:pyruvate dehydrogenase E2 component (dihydrolipoamide acetyltransferase)
MAHEIVIPRLGWSMEEGTFVGWLKGDGDSVKRGEPIFELEGEKATQEIEAVDEGILRIPPDSPAPGSIVPVGTIVGYLVAEGETLPSRSVPTVVPTGAESQTSSLSNLDQNRRTDALRSPNHLEPTVASPRAKRVARELGIDWKSLTGSGAGGRIREHDVRAVAASPTSSASIAVAGQPSPLTGRRRVIARRMVTSHQQTVPVTLCTKVDATNLVNLRDQFKSAGHAAVPTYQDLVMKLVAELLTRHPTLAGRWEGDSIVLPAADEIHIGIAVDSADGLLVPVVRNVRGLSVAELAAQTRQLIDRARAGRISAAEMQGGVFTITNLGAFGIEAFTPIINFPESAILGLGAIRREPVVLDDGQIAARHQWSLSLTFDHRAIDGAPAARFVQELVNAVANPPAWLQNIRAGAAVR